MAELVGALLQAKHPYDRGVGDGAQRQDNLQVGHRRHFELQEGTAGTDLRTRRLVLRRHAPYGIGDPAALRARIAVDPQESRSEEQTSELQSLMRISYAVHCLKKTNTQKHINQ